MNEALENLKMRHEEEVLSELVAWLRAKKLYDDAANDIPLLPRTQPRPTVVCLCGSVRFRDAFMKAYREETLAGKIVLSVGVMLHEGDEPISFGDEEYETVKPRLDELHLRKIDLADEVLVLNVDGYIGESTAREIKYAEIQGKKVRYLEPIREA